MTQRAQDLLREAMNLPPEERADVAAELLASLDEGPGDDSAMVQSAWAREIERRAKQALASESKGEPWPDVRSRIVGRLPKG